MAGVDRVSATSMQAWFRRLFKPEYVFQPHIAMRRARALAGLAARSDVGVREYRLPWGVPLCVPAGDDHARMLDTLGVVDLAVTEALWRLTDPDDHAIDAGANIGYMTSVLLARVRAADGGHVTAVEAHPGVRRDLARNVDAWIAAGVGDVEVVAAALSSADGSVSMVEPGEFGTNRGLARVSQNPAMEAGHLSVRSVTLDALVPSPARVGMLKLDVEGHELQVLEGAGRLLREGRVRDCVFEDHGAAPTAVMTRFIESGYDVVRVDRTLAGPVLLPAESDGLTPWLPANYLATLDSVRARARFHPRGWQCLARTPPPATGSKP